MKDVVAEVAKNIERILELITATLFPGRDETKKYGISKETSWTITFSNKSNKDEQGLLSPYIFLQEVLEKTAS